MTKKKSIWAFALALLFAVPIICFFTACGGHQHQYSDDWSTSDSQHWHACIDKNCKERKDLGNHEFGEWITKTEADYGVDKVEKRMCSVCKYEETRTIADSALKAKARTIKLDTIDSSILNVTYSGMEYSNVEKMKSEATISGARSGEIIVEFKVKGSDEDFSQVVPKNAGEYAFRVKVSATAEWQSAQSEVGYLTITPKMLSAPSSFAITKDYDGTSNIHTFSSEEGVCAGDEVHLITTTSTVEPIEYSLTGADVQLDNANYVVSISSEQAITLKVKDTRDFYMAIYDVGTLPEQGVVITGYISRGTINVNDKIEISGYSGELTVLGLAIEAKSATSATYKQTTTILLGTGVSKDDFKSGQIVSKPGTMQSHKKFVATIKMLTEDEGGRKTPITTNYKPTTKFYEYTTKSSGETILYACSINSTVTFDAEMIMPGTSATVEIVLDSETPLWEGLTFIFYESGKIVATGTITQIIE